MLHAVRVSKKYIKIKLYYYNEGMSNYASYIEWNLEKEMTDDVRIPANGYDK